MLPGLDDVRHRQSARTHRRGGLDLSCPSCRTEVIMEHARKDEILSIQTKLTQEALGEAKFLYITGSDDPFGSPYFGVAPANANPSPGRELRFA